MFLGFIFQGLQTENNYCQHGVLQYWGLKLLSSSLATCHQLFWQDKHRWAYGCYLVHLFFNWQRFRADDFQIPQHRKAPVVSGHCNRQSEKNEKYD